MCSELGAIFVVNLSISHLLDLLQFGVNVRGSSIIEQRLIDKEEFLYSFIDSQQEIVLKRNFERMNRIHREITRRSECTKTNNHLNNINHLNHNDTQSS